MKLRGCCQGCCPAPSGSQDGGAPAAGFGRFTKGTETEAGVRACPGCQQRKEEVGAETVAGIQTQSVGQRHQPPPPAPSPRGGLLTPPPGRLHGRSGGSGARDESSRLVPPSGSPRQRTPAPSRDHAVGSADSILLRVLHQTRCGLRRRGEERGVWPMRASLSHPPSNRPLFPGRGGT